MNLSINQFINQTANEMTLALSAKMKNCQNFAADLLILSCNFIEEDYNIRLLNYLLYNIKSSIPEQVIYYNVHKKIAFKI